MAHIVPKKEARGSIITLIIYEAWVRPLTPFSKLSLFPFPSMQWKYERATTPPKKPFFCFLSQNLFPRLYVCICKVFSDTTASFNKRGRCTRKGTGIVLLEGVNGTRVECSQLTTNPGIIDIIITRDWNGIWAIPHKIFARWLRSHF